MHIICLTPLEEGVYNDHKADHIITPPDGWAMIPEDFPLPSTFPRLGSIEAEEVVHTKEVEVADGVVETVEYTIMTVTAMTEGTLPAPSPDDDREPTTDEILNAMLGVTV